MNSPDTDDTALQTAILALVARADYRPLKPRAIARRLQVPREQVAELKKAIKRLVRQGRLAYGPSHLVLNGPGNPGRVGRAQRAPPETRIGEKDGGARSARPTLQAVDPAIAGTGEQEEKARKKAARRERKEAAGQGRITGVFRRAAGGFGFVRPAASSGGETPDIYVTAADAHDAASGDLVLVEVSQRGRPGQRGPQGRIVEVIERQTHNFVGTYIESAGAAYVQVDGTLFAQPVFVGDPGAKAARPGDKVVLEMVRFPTHVRDGEGVVVEVLGAQGAPGVDLLSILREFQLPEHFAADALDEARAEADRWDETALDGRRDLSGETIVTIDPVDARDFDDAISLVESADGHWRLGVHIADVSHFVRPKTALDREARARATSVYLPDRVIPMLPEVISNGLASLQPGKMRYAKTAFLDFDAEGLLLGAEFCNTAITSSKRLTYEQVDAFLAEPEAWRRKLGVKVHDLLGRMHRLAMILRQRRFRRGALELSLREVKIDLDRDGRVVGAHVVENTESHQIIEEFMLAANEAVAAGLRDAGFHFLRRVHQAPDQRKLAALRQFVTDLGFQVESLEDRFALQKLLGEVATLPEQHAINYAMLRSLQQAIYSPAEEGHYALASDCYCHFTSPIRRYPDLTIHRLIDALLSGRKPRGLAHFSAPAGGRSASKNVPVPLEAPAGLVALGQYCSDQERRAEMAERELTKMKLLAYLSGRVGEEMEGLITGVESFGLFVQGIELPAEGLVPVMVLPADNYDFDRTGHTLTGRRAGAVYRLGDRVRVAVARVDLERRALDFRLIAHHPRHKPSRPVRRKTVPAKGKSPRKARR